MIDRGELFGAFGALGAGVALDGAHVFAADHGKKANREIMAPLSNHHHHFCGIHCAKKDPRIQIITQHYCGTIGDGMQQCLMYDSIKKNARLLGVEYIISDAIFRKLPEVEKRYWHPHTYEVLAGGLIAPLMNGADEIAFMKGLLTTWGKTWQTWPDPTMPVPMGEPMLMWSLMGDGQVDPKLLAARDKEFDVSTADIRKKRIAAIGYDVPAVSPPKDMDVIGRQWTDGGPDKPTSKK